MSLLKAELFKQKKFCVGLKKLCWSKIKRARTDYGQIYEEVRRFLTKAVRFSRWENESPNWYRTPLAQLIHLPEFLQFPVPTPFLWLSALKISRDAWSKTYINDERARDERYRALWCVLKAPASLSENVRDRSGWLHDKPHRAQQDQKWGISGYIARKAPRFNSLFRNLLNISGKSVYFSFFSALCLG